MQKAVAKCTITELITKLIADEISNDIIERTKKIHPMK
jgi:ribosomal protein S3AE